MSDDGEPQNPNPMAVTGNIAINVSDALRVNARAEVKIMIHGFDRVFLTEARRAAERATAGLAQDDGETVAGAAATAVLLSAAACEARLSEYVTEHEGAIGAPTVKQIRRPSRDRGNAVKQWRLLFANRARTFKCEDSREFRALGCLFELRDLVAHRHARYYKPGEWPDKLKACIEKQAIPVIRAADIDWTSGTYVVSVAVWAHQTAAEWLATADGLGIAGRQ